jgi:hypothetical protein
LAARERGDRTPASSVGIDERLVLVAFELNHLNTRGRALAYVVLVSAVSRPKSGVSYVEPGGVCLGAELSIDGGGESVATRAELVGDCAKRDQETLRAVG